MKRVLAMCLAVLMVILVTPATADAASESVTITVTADKVTLNPGDTVNFEVRLGAVEDLGGLEFNVSIPDGLTIDEGSIKMQDGLKDILKSDGDIVPPSNRNDLLWAYTVGAESYTGASELSILSFSCTVDADAVFEKKGVTLLMQNCFDGSVSMNPITVNLIPAEITVEKAKIPVSGVSLDQSSIVLADGASGKLTATVTPAGADNQKVTWSSDNTEVATVAADGTVTALKAGTANITVTTEDGGKTASCKVVVNCNHDMVRQEAVTATCGKDGNIEYYSCSKCGKKYRDAAGREEVTEVTVPATGEHGDTEIQGAVAATEEAEGYTGDTYCKVCGNKIADGETIARLPHTHVMTKTEAVVPECEKDGNVEYYTCSKCGKTYADEAGKRELESVVDKATGHTAEEWFRDEEIHWQLCSVCEKEFNKESHNYKWVVDKAATEDETGLSHEECLCGSKRSEGTVVPKLDHVTHAGEKWFNDEESHWKVCTICGEKFDGESHSYKWVVDKAATEDETGLSHEECSVCGNRRSEDTVIPKLSHVHSEIQHYEAVAATCIEKGNLEYWTCSNKNCKDKYYGDAQCQIEITEIQLPINLDNHAGAGEWKKTAEKHVYTCICGTVLTDGAHEYDSDIDSDCNVCGYQREITVLPHTHTMTKTEAVKPECEKDGNVEYYICSVCGKIYADVEGTKELIDVAEKATGHVGNEWVSDEASHWKICSVCGKEFGKETHNYQLDGNGSNAECNVCGYKSVYVIIQGANAVYAAGSEDGLTFTANGAFSLFQSVEVDGSIVDPVNYEVKEGSTVVTLKKSYLDTLSFAEHTLRIVYSDGLAAVTQFALKEQANTDGNIGNSDDNNANDTNSGNADNKNNASAKNGETSPVTGDENRLIVWMVLATSSLVLMAVLLVYGRKRRNK